MTLYLKYRSQTLDELDLDSVRESLKKIVATGNVPHALLFAGPKGTGKTSSARIMAKILNCLDEKNKPCGKCQQCISITAGNNLDVIELDAASHRGIDDIRTLKDGLKLAPTAGKKKIYIIDEAHMLTTEASNALLKTLEEPPDHVVFILATTNPEKILDTIKSRAVVINFTKATTEEVVKSIQRIVKGEKLKINQEILELIAKASDGSFRDAAKSLEQILAEGKSLDKDTISEFLFHSSEAEVLHFVETIFESNSKNSLKEIEKLIQKGVKVSNLIDETTRILRDELLHLHGIGEGKLQDLDQDQLVHLIELLTKARKEILNSSIEQLPLELAVIDFSTRSENSELVEKIENRDEETFAKKKKEEIKTEKETEVSQKISSPAVKVTELNQDVWKKVLEIVKPINASIEALLRSSQPIGFEKDTLKLGVFYKFHKERLEDARNKKILEETIGQVLGRDLVKVSCILTEPPQKKVATEAIADGVLTESKDQDIIDIAEKIFNN